MHTDSQTGSTRRELKIIAGVKHFIHREACGQRCRPPLTGGSKSLPLTGPAAETLAALRADAAQLFAQYDTILADVEGGTVRDETGKDRPACKTIPVTVALNLYDRTRGLLATEATLCDRWQAIFPALWQAAAAALTAAEQSEQARRRALAKALEIANGGGPLHHDRVTLAVRTLPRFTAEREAAAGVAKRLGEDRASIAARSEWIGRILDAARVGVLPWERD
jgi:hypothetical protein